MAVEEGKRISASYENKMELFVAHRGLASELALVAAEVAAEAAEVAEQPGSLWSKKPRGAILEKFFWNGESNLPHESEHNWRLH